MNIKTAFEKGNYSEVISLAEEMHSRFNGFSEDIEAQEQMALYEQLWIDQGTVENAKAEALKSAQGAAREITKISKSNSNSTGEIDLFIGYINQSDKAMI